MRSASDRSARLALAGCRGDCHGAEALRAEADADETGVLMVTVGLLKHFEQSRADRAAELRRAINALRQRAEP